MDSFLVFSLRPNRSRSAAIRSYRDNACHKVCGTSMVPFLMAKVARGPDGDPNISNEQIYSALLAIVHIERPLALHDDHYRCCALTGYRLNWFLHRTAADVFRRGQQIRHKVTTYSRCEFHLLVALKFVWRKRAVNNFSLGLDEIANLTWQSIIILRK